MVLFFDLDGTLLVDGVISEKCREALSKAKSKGHILILNTGRSPAFVPKEIFNDPLFAGHICGSSYTALFGQVLARQPLSRETLAVVYDFAKAEDVQVIFEGEKENFYAQVTRDGQKDAKEIFTRQELPAIVKVTFWCAPERVPADAFPGLRIVHFKSYAEGICIGYDKSSGMKLILDCLGAKRTETAAFGDSENDIDMLKFAGFALAMKNAPAYFDEFCRFRATDEKEGAAHAIEYFLAFEEAIRQKPRSGEDVAF